MSQDPWSATQASFMPTGISQHECAGDASLWGPPRKPMDVQCAAADDERVDHHPELVAPHVPERITSNLNGYVEDLVWR
jgi:hypothetical protein